MALTSHHRQTLPFIINLLLLLVKLRSLPQLARTLTSVLPSCTRSSVEVGRSTVKSNGRDG